MTDASHPPDYLGAATEARFLAAFSEGAVITKRAAADLIGLDEKTLDALSDQQVIRAVRKSCSRHRGYTERDLRAYLLEGPDVACTTPKPRPTPAANGRVVNFTDRRREPLRR